MSDFPNNYSILPLFLHTATLWGVGLDVRNHVSNAAYASFAWPAANQAVYMPMSIPWPYPVQRVFWCNGSVITSSNADFGIYTASGKKIYSTGSTAQSGTSAIQYVTPGTPFLLDAGNYYFALTFSNTTNRGWGVGLGTAGQGAVSGILIQTSALPLPASATFATSGTAGALGICGITRTASGF